MQFSGTQPPWGHLQAIAAGVTLVLAAWAVQAQYCLLPMSQIQFAYTGASESDGVAEIKVSLTAASKPERDGELCHD